MIFIEARLKLISRAPWAERERLSVYSLFQLDLKPWLLPLCNEETVPMYPRLQRTEVLGLTAQTALAQEPTTGSSYRHRCGLGTPREPTPFLLLPRTGASLSLACIALA